jgi:hypothetical protein
MSQTDALPTANTAISPLPLPTPDIKHAEEVIGDGWTIVVIEDLLRGANQYSERVEPMEVEPAAGSGGSAAATTEAMSPPAPQSPAPAPAPAVAQSPVEQQLAQVMAMMQTMNQRLASAEDRAKAAEAERDQAKEDLKVSHERTEKLSGREGQKKKQSRSS